MAAQPRPTTFCAVEDCRGLDDEYAGGYHWLGDPMPPAEARQRYPERELVDLVGVSEAQRARLVAKHRKEREAGTGRRSYHPAAAAHFHGFWADEDEDGKGDQQYVYCGDFIKVNVGDENTKGWSVAQVEELYQTPDGARMMRVHWFYAAHDAATSLIYTKQKAGGKKAAAALSRLAVDGFDERQVFRARDNRLYQHEYLIDMLECKVEVVYVQPQTAPPAGCQFWWSFEFDRRFLTFEVPAHVAKQQRERFLAARKGKKAPVVLRGMDLYVGAGGLGYLDHISLLEDGRPDPAGVQTRTDWACDYEEDMARTFKANNQHCHPWNGRDPYKHCDDDKLLAWPRSVFGEVVAKSKAKGRRAPVKGGQAAKRQKQGSGAAASAGLLEGGEAAGSEEPAEEEEEEEESEDAEDAEEEEEEEEQAPAPKSKGKGKGRGKGSAAQAPVSITEGDCLPYHGKVGKVTQILQMRLGEKAPRQRKSNVAAGLLLRSMRRDERWLEFKVVMEAGGEQQEVWLSRKQLKGQDELLRGFVRKLRERQLIPFPGEVDFICGGPPCQGISGNNRHAMTEDILQDPRNRQLPVFIAYSEWFKPKYVLMENVQDILKKEDGLYIKYAMGSMLNMRYQVRVGLLAAGNFGVPQGRWRCFLWAAAPGQQLPAIPKPTHNCIHFKAGSRRDSQAAAPRCCATANNAKRLTSGFVSNEDCTMNGHPPVLLGDIFSDLPEVDNFELHERRRYETGPQRLTQLSSNYSQARKAAHLPENCGRRCMHALVPLPAQAWLRRDPRPWMTTRQDRFDAHEEYMHAGHNELVHAALQMAEAQGAAVMGTKMLLCKKNPLAPEAKGSKRESDDMDKGNHAFETWSASVRHVKDPKLQAVLWLQAEASRHGYAHTQGEMYVRRLREYLEADPQLRADPEAILCDHRPYFCNANDHLRLINVPPRNAGDDDRNFRNLDGIVQDEGGTYCCYGHSHAPRIDGKSACAGGGVYEPPKKEKKGAHKEYRVDQHNKEGWRGGALEGCAASTTFIPTGDVLVPQWCVTFKKGKSKGRGGCFGRQGPHETVATVVGRSEPHNLKGFPDYHVLLAKPKLSTKRFAGNPNIKQRFQQMGNAVSPQVAAALGRCLALAAVHASPPEEMLIAVPDPEYELLSEEWDATPGLPEAFYAHEYLAEFGSRSLEYLNNIVNFLGDDDSEEDDVQASAEDEDEEEESEEEEEEEDE
ncbi:hypothetical protein CHLNCDRAFT_52630 [Chlorella variabilis]|uniref:DNA (cytosine-5-)-methyltransferase n=1 Tax=Chlorella variabilis TaxID=554065 RepID=E1ZG50_CHLVA|nr:hypothetical protein CHLNCDRAFT_52630 [Chlorella variabilis]EFN55234.1 hypothetical protein CHLNCDRAFT_52630 [Chlorella variabilis]|eukprot:XP_005847336.1 hypothetical protein CHLNCDRAFT_52630 [Chlorella variabilis]